MTLERTLMVEKLRKDMCHRVSVLRQDGQPAIHILIVLYMAASDRKGSTAFGMGVTSQFYRVDKSSNVELVSTEDFLLRLWHILGTQALTLSSHYGLRSGFVSGLFDKFFLYYCKSLHF